MQPSPADAITAACHLSSTVETACARVRRRETAGHVLKRGGHIRRALADLVALRHAAVDVLDEQRLLRGRKGFDAIFDFVVRAAGQRPAQGSSSFGANHGAESASEWL